MYTHTCIYINKRHVYKLGYKQGYKNQTRQSAYPQGISLKKKKKKLIICYPDFKRTKIFNVSLPPDISIYMAN